MISKIISFTAAALLSATLVFAAGSVSGKVTKVDGDKVTVSIDGAVPAWAKKGASVSVSGASPKIVSVQGNELTLKMSKAKAAKIALDSSLTVSESDDDEMQGC